MNSCSAAKSSAALVSVKVDAGALADASVTEAERVMSRRQIPMVRRRVLGTRRRINGQVRAAAM
jgi:hypothetical protein